MDVPNALSIDAVIEDMAAFTGIERAFPSRVVIQNFQFGGAQPSYKLDRKHVENLYEISRADMPPTFCFSASLVDRWKLMNSLIVQRHVVHGSLGPDIEVNTGSALATLIGYPLLERVAQVWTDAWDANGKLKADIGEEVGLTDKSGKPRTRKAGDFLSGFGDRMLILRTKLTEDFRVGIDLFDKALSRPDFPGAREANPLFQRMSARRNAWAHGGAFEESEPYLLALVVAFVYVASRESASRRSTQR
jgi:hypothetical protein